MLSYCLGYFCLWSGCPIRMMLGAPTREGNRRPVSWWVKGSGCGGKPPRKGGLLTALHLGAPASQSTLLSSFSSADYSVGVIAQSESMTRRSSPPYHSGCLLFSSG